MSAPVVDRAMLDAAIAALPADGLASARREAAERFVAAGFPTVGQEDWKYTNLSRVAELSADWLSSAAAKEPPVVASHDAGNDILGAVDAHWIIVRDGVIAGELPDVAGIDIERLAGSDLQTQADDAMSAFNAALLRDGLRISVARAAAPVKPIGVLYVDHPTNAVAQTRILVELGETARLQLFEVCASTGDGRQFTNSVFDARLGSGAHLDHVRIQVRASEHSGVNRVHARLENDAGMHHNSIDLGGALSRNDVVAEIAGAGANVQLNGLYLASGEQHIDNHTSIIHGVGPSGSEEEYRGILAGRSQCVFNGKVIVAEGADGTDSSQANHNLLLSDRAEIDTKPELEIYADDVKCAHGATVGQLDEASLFYLRSRGLDEDQAKQVLTRAFAAGTLSSLAVPACHDLVAARLDEKLAAMVGDDDD